MTKTRMLRDLKVKNVIFDGPTTVVLIDDGKDENGKQRYLVGKSVCNEADVYDPVVGFKLAFMNAAEVTHGNKGLMNENIKKLYMAQKEK